MNSSILKILAACIIIAAFLVINFGCKKGSVEIAGPVPGKLVTASIAGRVTDLNDVPIRNASVTAGTATTSTDINGRFIINNAQLVDDAGFVKISADGYFSGARTFFTSVKAINNVKIKLIPKLVSGKFSAGSGGTINITNGGVADFDATGVVNAATNVAYNGEVSVSSIYLDPGSPVFKESMPGDLRGVNTSNQQSILKTFGMASIEMDDASGEKLQLASGKTATITLPISPSIQGNAPATIALWYFDEKTGLWKQEGSATRQGNNYVGKVNHFSFWAVGELISSIQLTATFIDTSLAVYSNKSILIYRADSTFASGYTDGNGEISGLVPANEILTMEVFNDCGVVAYTETIGPFNSDLDLGLTIIEDNCQTPVVPDSTEYISITIKGNVYSLSSQIIQEYPDTSGNYITNLMAHSMDNSKYLLVSIFNSTTVSPGNYPCDVYANLGDSTYQVYPNNSGTAIVTQYDPVGGYIIGSASGWMRNSTGGTLSNDSIPFTCNYKIRRTE